MMRINGSLRASILLAFLLACAAAPGAEAQSLFQSLFGNIFKSAPPKPARPSAPPAEYAPMRQGTDFAIQNYSPRSDKTHRPFSGGSYRTVCVRTCDGYYFPISRSASHSKFRKDADACSARCSGAKLYYLPRQSEDMAAMVDLGGRRYDQLRTAFLYRKKLIDGCACRPMPWSAAERARHNRYAYAAEILKQTEERAQKLREGAITTVAERSPDADSKTAGDDAVSEPQKGTADDLVSEERTGTVPETESAYLAAVKTAIADGTNEPAAAKPEGQMPVEKVSYTPQRSKKRARITSRKTRRARKSRRRPAKSNGWSFAGGGKHTWPGDR